MLLAGLTNNIHISLSTTGDRQRAEEKSKFQWSAVVEHFTHSLSLLPFSYSSLQ